MSFSLDHFRTRLSGHIDTLRPSFSIEKQLLAESEILTLADGDFLALHYPLPLKPERTLLIIPGMASNRHSPIVKATAKALMTKGYTPAIVELRNCADIPGSTTHFFNAGSDNDLAEVIQHLCEKIGSPLTGIIGFSLGANILVKWAANNPDATLQTAFIHCISLPLDLRLTALVADKGFNRLYQKMIISRYRQLLTRRHDRATQRFLPSLMKITRMYDFDEQITVPLNGYDSVEQYYTENSSLQFINHIGIPCKISNSTNDPLIPYNALYKSIQLRQNLELNLLPYGGHLGMLHRSLLHKIECPPPNLLSNRNL